ncbi:MAG: glycosyltransferase family 4 protein [Caldilineaceae bacterium]|nr:glycosyltransferase family 4 protein [Caldilineaceae bacterium]
MLGPSMELRTLHFLVANMRNGDATSQHTFDLVRLLRERGVAIQIFHNYPNGPLPDDIQPLVQHVDYAQYHPNADLTILQYPVWFPLAERFRQVAGAAIFWYHGVTPPSLWGARPGLEMVQTAEVRTELAWHAHLAVAASPFTADELHRHSDYPRERIRVVPLNIDVGALAQRPGEDELNLLRRQWHAEGKRILLYVGRIAGNKRIDLLIRALAQLQRSNLMLLVVGDVVMNDASRILHPELEALAAQLGVADQVVFTGRVPHVTPYLHLADIVLLPSQHEGFGVPVAEAMAAGTPVIASASGALPWVLGAANEGNPDTEPAGLLFREGNVDDLVAQITRLLDDPNLRSALVAQGRTRVREFSKERFATNVVAVIDEAMKLAQQDRPPANTLAAPPLATYADIVIRDYRVRSGAPVVGRLIEWVRNNSTTHVKEAYLDRILERQVNYNRLLATEVAALQNELSGLRAQMSEMRRQVAALKNDTSNDTKEPRP